MSLYEIAEPHTFVWIAKSLAHVLWQGTLFAGLAAMVGQGLRNRSTQARYMLHCVALFMIVACLPLNLWVFAPTDPAPVFPVPGIQMGDAVPFVAGIPETNEDHGDTTVDWHAPLAAGPADSKTSIEADGPLGAESTSGSVWISASKWIVAVYLLGMIAMLFRLMMGVYGGHRLRSTATPVVDSRVQDILAHVADQLCLRAVPIVAYSARVTTPLVVGVVKPAILLPVAIMSNLTTGQVESLLLHELAHIRRYDHVVNLLQRMVEALLFFHPAVWWLSHKISVEREHCCDDQAIAWGSEPCDYAESLIRVSELRFRAAGLGASGAATLAASGGKTTRLHRRVLHVLGMPLPGPNPGLTRLGVAVMLALAVSTAAIVATRAGDSDNALRSGTVEISVSDRERPHNEADDLLRTNDVTTTGAGEIVWDEERRGWQVGAKLISTTNKLQPGDPVVVQLLLRNATKEPQTVVLQRYDATHPTLGADGRISMNISGSSENRHQHVIAPGAILEKPQYRVVLSTQGMLHGEYHIDPQPAFWQPDKDDPNSATGIGRKTPIHFMLGDPSAVTYSQPPVEKDPALRIHWGNHVSGLVVGMRLPQGRVLWKNNSRIEAEMFVCNVSDRTITFDYEVPPPSEWNSHIKTSDGKDVQLDFTWTSGLRQPATRSLSLQPGAQACLTELGGPAIQVLKEKTPFKQGDPPRLITSGGQFTWEAYLVVQQRNISDLTMVIGSGAVPLEIGDDKVVAEATLGDSKPESGTTNKPSATDASGPDKPESNQVADRDAMLACARAVAAGDWETLEQIWEFQDDLDREFAQKFAKMCTQTPDMSVELVSMQRLGEDSLFACFLMRNGPDQFGEQPAPLLLAFHRKEDRWQCPSPTNLRLIINARSMGVEKIGRRAVSQSMIALRFGSSEIDFQIPLMKARADAFARLAKPPYNLSQFEQIAEQMKKQIEEQEVFLRQVQSRADLWRLALEKSGKELLPQEDDFYLVFYLEAAQNDPNIRELSFASSQETFRAEPFPCLTEDVILEAAVVTDKDQQKPVIDVKLTEGGAKLFGQLTQDSIGKRLAIVIDGKVIAAPTIRTAIPSGHARIDGNFTQQEADAIADKLNSYRKSAREFLDTIGKEM